MKLDLLKNIKEPITSICSDSENIYIGTLTNSLFKFSKDLKTFSKKEFPTITDFSNSEKGKKKRNNSKFARLSNPNNKKRKFIRRIKHRIQIK